MAVILFHLGYRWIPGGFIGVDVFFVLSGYLITGLLLGELASTNTIGLRRFYARRARRLLPASLAVLVVVIVLGLSLFDAVQRKSLGGDAFWAALYSANWRFAFVGGDYFAPGDVPSPLVHYWSLAVEEQFYVVWPALLLLLHLVGKRLTRTEAGVAGFLVASLSALVVASVAVSLALTGEPIGYYGTHSRAYQLLAGALFAAALHRWPRVATADPDRRSRSIVATVATAVSLVWLARLAHSIPEAVDYPGTEGIWVTIASLVLIASVDLAPAGLGARILGFAPFAAVGRLSYSLYIWHWPVIVLVPVLIERGDLSTAWSDPLRLAVLMVMIAGASYLIVERPIRFRLAPKARPLGVVGIGLALSILTAVSAHRLLQPDTDFERDVLATVDDIAPSDPCPYSRESWKDAEAAPCVLRRGAPDAPVIALVGDSHAQAWSPAVEVMADERNATLVRLTRRACTPVDVTPYVRSETNQLLVERDCTEWRREAFPKLVERFDPDVIFLVNRSNGRSFVVNGEYLEVGTPEQLRAWIEGWEWTLDTLSAGSGTVAVSTILPTMPWRVPACLAEAGRDLGCDMPVEDDRGVTPFNEAIRELDEGSGGDVRVVDPIDIACPDDICQAMIGDQVVRRDDNHLTATYARSRADELSARFAEIGVPL